jgi:hypothetical protein
MLMMRGGIGGIRREIHRLFTTSRRSIREKQSLNTKNDKILGILAAGCLQFDSLLLLCYDWIEAKSLIVVI